MRIIAHNHLGYWAARFDGSTPDSFGGPDAFKAMRRLVEISPARHLTLKDFEPDLEECRLNRVEMVLKDRDRGGEGAGDKTEQAGKEPCPECGGSGKYVGLSEVEMCRACGGIKPKNQNDSPRLGN